MTVKTIQLEKPTTADYARFLRLRNIKYKDVDDRYYQVGNIRGEQGWILHVSATKALVQELYNRLIPELSKEKITFKFLQNPGQVEKTVSGSYGYTWLGKVIRVYPETTEKAVQLAKRLIELTADLIGPVIPTDSWLGGTVYTRYGAFNPAVMTNANGQTENYIHDASGQLIKDPNDVPFQVIKGVTWPFAEIAPPQPATATKTLHNRYMVRTELRAKPKGRVLKTYRVNGLSIKSAVVKEAKHGMCDELDRSLAERLYWQHKLHRTLTDFIRLPKIFEVFEERGNTYLAMELIKGQSLQEAITGVYTEGAWRTLDVDGKTKLLNYLHELLSIVGRFHEHGYVHRDLTPENFIVDGKNRLVMIDLELSYDLNAQHPSPPYRLGTMGYMSPEQLNTETPTVKEDIFALGALMIVFFTNMSPAKFNSSDAEGIKAKLSFFLDHEPTIDIITKCLNTDPMLRPTLGDIHDVVENLRSHVTDNINYNITAPPTTSPAVVQEIIEATLLSFSKPTMAIEGKPWHSNQLELSALLGNKQTDYCYYPGFHTGIAGVLTTIAQASLAGVKINNQVVNAYNRNLRHLQRTFLAQLPSRVQPGLYYGTAGVGIALATGIQSGLIKGTQDVKDTLLRCLQQDNPALNLAHGCAGQGIAILRALSVIGDAKAQQLLEPIASAILNAQQPDGSWAEGKEKKNGLSEGVAGVVLFLLRYGHAFKDEKATQAATRGLAYLKKQALRSHGKVYWRVSNKSTNAEIGLHEGFTGIALTLINSYRYLKDISLLSLAEEALNNYAQQPLNSDFTFITGLSGLGEVYQELYNITKIEEWLQRIQWISNVLCHTSYHQNDGSAYWVLNPNQFNTADLFTGNSGPVHFLLRHQFPNTGFII
jgi:serine/threonine protein kinase